MNTLAPSFFNSIILILEGNEDMHESLNEFKFRPDTITNSRVICPCAPKKLLYNVVNTLAPPFLIILEGNEDMHESLNELKFRPDTTTNSRVISPCAPKNCYIML